MVVRISKTGAIYYEPPFSEEELEERGLCAGYAPALVALRQSATGRHAFVVAEADVQLGWCIKRDEGWYIEDMNRASLAGPFRSLAAATSAGQRVFKEAASTAPVGQ